MKKKIYISLIVCFAAFELFAQSSPYTLLKPDRVFDGVTMHTGWVVLLKNDSIAAAGPMQFKLPAGTTIIELRSFQQCLPQGTLRKTGVSFP